MIARREAVPFESGFTLLELLVIVGIMGLMVTAGIVSVRTGQGAARVRGATRDVFAAIRQARSTALVTQQPAIVTYSNSSEDGENVAKVEITSARLMTAGVDLSAVRTITGRPLKGYERQDRGEKAARPAAGDEAQEQKEEGQTLEDILFAPIATDVVRGMRIKVVMGEDGLGEEDMAQKPKASVFSNVDFLLGLYEKEKGGGKKQDGEAKEAQSDGKPDDKSAEDEMQKPVSVVWETNGRVEPHMVWVYADGRRPEDGLAIKIDRFGAAKVISGDGREEE